VTATAVALGPVHEAGLAALRQAGGRVLALADDAPGTAVWVGDAVAEAFAADVLLDGLLGIGARGGLREPAAWLVGLLEPLLAEDGGPTVIAVDVPSGIGVDDGTLPGPVLPADRTVTFGVPKPGLLLPPAASLVGELTVVDLGLRGVLDDLETAPAVRRATKTDLAALWPRPNAFSHKYTRGVVGVLAGSDTYPGAAVLAVAGAQASGAGMVRFVGPGAVRAMVLARHPEVVAGSGRAQAWVVGPGLTDGHLGRARERIVASLHQQVPVVVDAGGLAALPERAEGAVVTPHAGELVELLSARDVQVDREQVEAEPLRWASEAARRTGAVVLLKGAVTVIVGPDGRDVWTQDDATPWLATAGAGDVLAGLLGGLLAGLTADGETLTTSALAGAAAAAVSVHGRAAVAAGDGPLTASRVAESVPSVIAELW
jgi:ADP-dependent NAD(P)H-hydrate dehydratase / NAD(P)H-hydrate epimerase